MILGKRGAVDQITRAAGATYYLLNENEWYKAAYHDPTKGGSNYWVYATQSDDQPDNTLSAGSNYANFADSDFTMTPGQVRSGTAQYLHNVGSFTGSTSYYGTFDQSGSLWELLETHVGIEPVARGGSWSNNGQFLPSTVRRLVSAGTSNSTYGLRIAKPMP